MTTHSTAPNKDRPNIDQANEAQPQHGIVNEALACIAELQAALPGAVLTERSDVQSYECDALVALNEVPLAVVLPETVEQVQTAIKTAAKYQVPIVPRGAGTGLSGGAVPLAHGIVLSLAKMATILNVDPVAQTATVQPGVRNISISQAAEAHGLFYAPDPSSQLACTIGGNVAENSGGLHCLKYGLTVHNVLAVSFISASGELIKVGSEWLDTPGYDLLGVMTGSEGLLGIMVEVVVKLVPKPEQKNLIMAGFGSLNDAANAVAAIITRGMTPAGLEMMDKMAIQVSEDFCQAGYPTDAAALLLCECDGDSLSCELETQRIKDVFAEFNASSIEVAHSAEHQAQLWLGRKSAFPATGRISPDYYCMDGTIPRGKIAEVLSSIEAYSEAFGLRCVNVFHAGDGNLHPLILYDSSQPGELHLAEEFGSKILQTCVAVGGTITGEHGVGLEKLNEMCVQFGSAELQSFHALKAAFDPQGLLNPNKAVPTLHRCAEFGALHVHNGELPHPDIPRF